MVSRSPPSTCPSDASCGVEPSGADVAAALREASFSPLSNTWHDPNGTYGTKPRGLLNAAADLLDAARWRPIESAPRDGTRVLVILKDPIPEPGRADLRNWDGRPFVAQHMGGASEWCFAAPVGQGGFPDEWMAGWRPLPSPPDEPPTPTSPSDSAEGE